MFSSLALVVCLCGGRVILWIYRGVIVGMGVVLCEALCVTSYVHEKCSINKVEVILKIVPVSLNAT